MSDGKTLAWTQKDSSKEFATFQLPCGKCLACRLEYARQWAVRCVHEASCFEQNSFITLTYSDEHLGDGKLKYEHIQEFQKKLRNHIFGKALKDEFPDLVQRLARKKFKEKSLEEKKKFWEKYRVSMFVTGEYGDLSKRAHWHLIIFNWRPEDGEKKYVSERGDQVFVSRTLSSLWERGISEYGSVTFESAGYCARYSAKKLSHGRDGSHPFVPISRKSAKYAIGKKFIEKHWKDVFGLGKCVIMTSEGKAVESGIPRYYEKWLKENRPDDWATYIMGVKERAIEKAGAQERREQERRKEMDSQRPLGKGPLISRNETRKRILKNKFKKLMENVKI